MRLVSRVDGVDLTPGSVDLWYWRRHWLDREFQPGDDEISPQWIPIPRNIRSPWRQFSMAPYWYQDHRRRQLDRRLRQNVILEAARLGRAFRQQLEYEPNPFRDQLGEGFGVMRTQIERAGKAGE